MTDRCKFCGLRHIDLCPRIKAIEYDQMRDLREDDGAGPLWGVKRIEFHGANWRERVTGVMDDG